MHKSQDLILTKIGTAHAALMACATAPEAKKVADIARAAEIYAKRQKLSKETVQYAHEVHIDAKTLMGEFLAKMEKNKGANGSKVTGNQRVPVKDSASTLNDLKLSKRESSEAQLLAHAAKSSELKTLHEEVRSGRKSVRHIRQAVKRKEHAQKVKRAAKTIPVINGGPYDIILADPPWMYDYCEAENREIENQYGTATIEEICGHKPNSSENSILFLWATAPKLKQALTVMESWGFNYRSCAVWDKEKIGMGYWWRIQHELLLVGTKGKPGCTPESERIGSIFRERRRGHSVKPETVYKWIERSFPSQSKHEMYCRKERKGWSASGNEI